MNARRKRDEWLKYGLKEQDLEAPISPKDIISRTFLLKIAWKHGLRTAAVVMACINVLLFLAGIAVMSLIWGPGEGSIAWLAVWVGAVALGGYIGTTDRVGHDLRVLSEMTSTEGLHGPNNQ